MTDKDPATIAKNASIVQRTYEASRQGVNTMTEPTDEELRTLHEDSRCDCALCKDVRRTIYQAGVASQAARIAELEVELGTQRQRADDNWVLVLAKNANLATLTRELAAITKAKQENDDRFMGERDQARRELAEAKALIGDLTNVEMWQRTRRELAEAREELRLLRPIESALRQFTLHDPLKSQVAAIDARRNGKTSAVEGARDDGPPRVGDVVRVVEIDPRDSEPMHDVGKDYVCEEWMAHSGQEYPLLITDGRELSTWCKVTVIRRAGQHEAKASECQECEGLGEYDDGVMPTRCSKGCPVPPRKVIAADLPGGPGPDANNVDVREWRRVNERSADRLAELERKVARLEFLVEPVIPSADRARKGE